MTTVYEKLKGAIKDLKHGYGFITHDATGDDYFFHRSNLEHPDEFDELVDGQPVEFRPTEGPKGKRALDVSPVVVVAAKPKRRRKTPNSV